MHCVMNKIFPPPLNICGSDGYALVWKYYVVYLFGLFLIDCSVDLLLIINPALQETDGLQPGTDNV